MKKRLIDRSSDKEVNTLKETITWLIDIESSAAELYAEAAAAFHEDENFSRFLALMSAEEHEHIKLLQQARDTISDKEIKRACFYFDDHFRKKIAAPFIRARRFLESGELTKATMIDILAEAEFSEWNELFLYTLDTFKVLHEDVEKAVADIDQHRKHVQEFILSLADGDSLIQRVRRLSHTGIKRVLIVEDNSAVARMLEALVADNVEVIIARDAQEGLSHIRQGYFDLIVSTIEMPEMHGIEMYKQALAMDPSLHLRFIFFTGTENRNYLDFIRDSKTLMLPKPSPVRLISEMMNEVLESTPVPQETTIY